MSSTFCTKCGTPAPPADLFCSNCGAGVNSRADAAATMAESRGPLLMVPPTWVTYMLTFVGKATLSRRQANTFQWTFALIGLVGSPIFFLWRDKFFGYSDWLWVSVPALVGAIWAGMAIRWMDDHDAW